MTKMLNIDNCYECSYCDMDEDVTCCPRNPHCIHPSTNIYSKQYKERLVDGEEIHPDCPLPDAPNQDPIELIREVIGGAARESCMYSTTEIVDNTWHCCDWSAWVERAAELLGIELPLPDARVELVSPCPACEYDDDGICFKDGTCDKYTDYIKDGGKQ